MSTIPERTRQPGLRSLRTRGWLLDLDADLAGARLSEQRPRSDVLRVEVVDIPTGTLTPTDMHDVLGEARAAIVLGGLLLARLKVGSRWGAELLGAGDLMLGSEGSSFGLVAMQRRDEVLEAMRLAVIDGRVFAELLRSPPLVAELQRRQDDRQGRLLRQMVAAKHPSTAERLWLCLWSLADRWGRVTPDGITLTLPLLHAQLADMVAATRPSVSLALSRLETEGRLVRHPHHLLLLGSPLDDTEG